MKRLCMYDLNKTPNKMLFFLSNEKYIVLLINAFVLEERQKKRES